MAEPGFWSMTDKETENFRAYLKKGGFVIFDDFRVNEGHWENLQQQMRLVLPEARWIEIDDGKHPVWHSFFEIDDPKALISHPTYDQGDGADLLGHLRGQRSDEAAASRSPTSTATSANTGSSRTRASRRWI